MQRGDYSTVMDSVYSKVRAWVWVTVGGDFSVTYRREKYKPIEKKIKGGSFLSLFLSLLVRVTIYLNLSASFQHYAYFLVR